MKFDTSKEGLNTLFRPYQVAILEHVWEMNKDTRTGIKSKQAHDYIIQTDDPELKKSRASVIFFLDDMVEEGYLSYESESGKGGYHRVYYPAMNREEFGRHVVETITAKLREVLRARAETTSIVFTGLSVSLVAFYYISTLRNAQRTHNYNWRRDRPNCFCRSTAGSVKQSSQETTQK